MIFADGMFYIQGCEDLDHLQSGRVQDALDLLWGSLVRLRKIHTSW